jgi:hypothetical protein
MVRFRAPSRGLVEKYRRNECRISWMMLRILRQTLIRNIKIYKLAAATDNKDGKTAE